MRKTIDFLLMVAISEFEKIPENDRTWMQFCFDCNQVASYAVYIECKDCVTKYISVNTYEGCPVCGSNKYTSFCFGCGAELKANYLDELLYDNSFEWSETELASIIKYLKNFNEETKGN